MKKLVLIIALAVFSVVNISAQEKVTKNDSIEVIDLNRTFSIGGKALMCLRSANMSKRNLQSLDWTLENNPVGDKNMVTLKVTNSKTGAIVAFQIWDDGVNVRMKRNRYKKDSSMYEVYDDMFSHLRMVQFSGDTYIILYYSEMKK